MIQSFSRPRQCWDNAVAESWFSTLKNELIHRRAWPTRAQARRAIFEFIEVLSRYAGDPPAGRWGRRRCGHRRDRRRLWGSCRAWFVARELPALR
jgi:hypothetical protein